MVVNPAQQLRRFTAQLTRWDRAAAALQRRDYPAFDREMAAFDREMAAFRKIERTHQHG